LCSSWQAVRNRGTLADFWGISVTSGDPVIP
jgi:hypothetical protein